MGVIELQRELIKLSDARQALSLRRFFKTAPGEYGAGDRFRGIRVPVIRKLSRKHQNISFADTKRLLKSPFHEDRLLSLLILIRRFSKGDEALKTRIYDLYLANTKFINNWDLVDASAGQIVGVFLQEKERDVLYSLAQSKDLWERRIAVMATFQFIKRGEFADTLKISRALLSDKEDLIHKAVGWMLREVGKRNLKTEEDFLGPHYRQMPRVMLRYAIEKFPEAKRRRYLQGRI